MSQTHNTNLKTLASHFRVNGLKHFKTKIYENDDVMIITWFLCTVIGAFLKSSGVVWTEQKLMRLQSETSVFKFLRCNVDGKHLMRLPCSTPNISYASLPSHPTLTFTAKDRKRHFIQTHVKITTITTAKINSKHATDDNENQKWMITREYSLPLSKFKQLPKLGVIFC